jgi:hypothetical protein
MGGKGGHQEETRFTKAPKPLIHETNNFLTSGDEASLRILQFCLDGIWIFWTHTLWHWAGVK